MPRMMAFRKIWKQTPPLRSAFASLLKGMGGWSGTEDTVPEGLPDPEKPVIRSDDKPGLQSYLETFGAAGLAVTVPQSAVPRSGT